MCDFPVFLPNRRLDSQTSKNNCKWSMAYDFIYCDRFMITMGAGDLEMRWEYLERGEQPTPISVVKFPSKMMLNARSSVGEKSRSWCGAISTAP